MPGPARHTVFGASIVLGLLALTGVGFLQAPRPAPAVLTRAGGAPPAAASFIVKSRVPIHPNPRALAAADFDRDGHKDLAVVNGSLHTVTILFGTGTAHFVSPHATRVPANADSIAVADIDRNGRLDLVVGVSAGRGSVSVLLGKGDGTFARPHTNVLGGSAGTRNPGTLSVADLNGDQRPDIIAARAGKVLVLLGRGDGTFRPARAFLADAPGSIASFVVGRLDGDRAPDVVAGSQDGVNVPVGAVSVLRGTGSGGFRTPRTTRTGLLIPDKLAVRDVNGDGKPDLLVANTAAAIDHEAGDHDYAAIVVSLGRGTGTFSRLAEYDFGMQGPSAFLVADFNRDGRPDLLHASTAGLTQLLGNGDGTFQAPDQFDTTPRLGGALVALGDFDGDGRPDLAVAAMAGHELSVFVNRAQP
jgi:FG-GAP-like repeat/FG-GAP repeat